MCLIAEIVMTIFGIVTLVKGKFTLSRNKIVTGPPAYAIGVLLTATLPLLLVVGLVVGVVIGFNAAAHHQPMPDMSKFAVFDFAGVGLVLLGVVLIAASCGKPPQRKPLVNFDDVAAPRSFPPPDPNNPYSPPYSSPPDS